MRKQIYPMGPCVEAVEYSGKHKKSEESGIKFRIFSSVYICRFLRIVTEKITKKFLFLLNAQNKSPVFVHLDNKKRLAEESSFASRLLCNVI